MARVLGFLPFPSNLRFLEFYEFWGLKYLDHDAVFDDGGLCRETRGRLQGTIQNNEAGSGQVWSLTQFYSVDFSQSWIGVRKCVFNKRTIKVRSC